MIAFYIVMSVLWGILLFLNSFKQYKWYICILFVLLGLLFWPFFVLAEVVMEIIRITKKEPEDEVKSEEDLRREEVLNIIRENIDTNE